MKKTFIFEILEKDITNLQVKFLNIYGMIKHAFLLFREFRFTKN